MQEQIRNFVITAHIDHGKSTLADRLLELTGTVEARKMHAQYLDTMGLEQERGITIKMQPVTMHYTLNAEPYTLNLIDTPGHVDFSYEVSRALAAVEGVILLVDATQGVQAQTIANLEAAILEDLIIVPAINKIDLAAANPDAVKKEIAALLTIDPADVLEISAKVGDGVPELLERVIEAIPPPRGAADAPFRALVFDSHYDDYRGVIAHVRIVDGVIHGGDKVRFIASGTQTELIEVGTFVPELRAGERLDTGSIGYLATGLKDPKDVRIGDTVVNGARGTAPLKARGGPSLSGTYPASLPGYLEPQPVVYASIFPEDADDFETLKDALEKLSLNDAALTRTPEESHALGRGFRLGFLGTLHLEIVVERLLREFGLTLIVTHPSVALVAELPDGEMLDVRTPRDFPEQAASVHEPWVKIEILVPPKHLSPVVQVVAETRGTVLATDTVTPTRLKITAEAPLLDVVEDFADRLKSATSGYASFSWVQSDERKGDLVKLDILVAHETVEALSKIVPKIRAEREGKAMVKKLKEILPRQLFAVAIQASIGSRVIARETLSALRKDVTAGLYGGDFTRKKKLLVKQRKGKKRMEKEGRVSIPAEVYIKLLKK